MVVAYRNIRRLVTIKSCLHRIINNFEEEKELLLEMQGLQAQHTVAEENVGDDARPTARRDSKLLLLAKLIRSNVARGTPLAHLCRFMPGSVGLGDRGSGVLGDYEATTGEKMCFVDQALIRLMILALEEARVKATIADARSTSYKLGVMHDGSSDRTYKNHLILVMTYIGKDGKEHTKFLRLCELPNHLAATTAATVSCVLEEEELFEATYFVASDTENKNFGKQMVPTS